MPAPVDSGEIATFRYSLVRARHLAFLFRLNAARQLERARRIGIDHWGGTASLETDRLNACRDVKIGSEA